MPINISTSPAVFHWQPACWLRVSGEDAANFLQGQFTNDLRGLTSSAPSGGSGAVYGLWLTLKGKVLADSFVLRGAGANEFWIGSYFSPAAVIRARLEGHIIADDVLIEDRTNDWRGISVVGPDGSLFAEQMRRGGSFVFAGRRDRAGSFEFVFPAASAGMSVVVDLAGAAVQVNAEFMERRRIAGGIPAITADVGPADLPNEAGLEADAISYTKGCYLGQEVMARLKSMGQVRRRLLRVKGAGGTWPVLPAAVFSGGRQIGELRSAVSDGAGGWIGLAMLSLLHLVPGVTLAFAPNAPEGLLLADTL